MSILPSLLFFFMFSLHSRLSSSFISSQDCSRISLSLLDLPNLLLVTERRRFGVVEVERKICERSIPPKNWKDGVGMVNRFSRDGVAGYLDGELSSARFNGPRSFAIDLEGNVYVSDKINRVIRKTSGSVAWVAVVLFCCTLGGLGFRKAVIDIYK